MPGHISYYLSRLLIIVIAAAVISYSYYQSLGIREGPTLIIEEPHNGETLDHSLVEIRGRASRVANISLNGRQIFVDQEGVFREELLLMYGYNIIGIEAQDRFGKHVVKKLELVYK